MEGVATSSDLPLYFEVGDSTWFLHRRRWRLGTVSKSVEGVLILQFDDEGKKVEHVVDIELERAIFKHDLSAPALTASNNGGGSGGSGPSSSSSSSAETLDLLNQLRYLSLPEAAHSIRPILLDSSSASSAQSSFSCPAASAIPSASPSDIPQALFGRHHALVSTAFSPSRIRFIANALSEARSGKNVCLLLPGGSGNATHAAEKASFFQTLCKSPFDDLGWDSDWQPSQSIGGAKPDLGSSVSTALEVLSAFWSNTTFPCHVPKTVRIFCKNSHVTGASVTLHPFERMSLGCVIPHSSRDNASSVPPLGQKRLSLPWWIVSAAAIRPELETELGLLNGLVYYGYLQTNGNLDGNDMEPEAEAAHYDHFIQQLTTLGITDVDRNHLLRTLSASILLGNIDFTASGDMQPACQNIAKTIASNLGLTLDNLRDALKPSAASPSASSFPSPSRPSRESAIRARDTLSSELYTASFEWLQDKINARLQPQAGRSASSLTLIDVPLLLKQGDADSNDFSPSAFCGGEAGLEHLYNNLVVEAASRCMAQREIKDRKAYLSEELGSSENPILRDLDLNPIIQRSSDCLDIPQQLHTAITTYVEQFALSPQKSPRTPRFQSDKLWPHFVEASSSSAALDRTASGSASSASSSSYTPYGSSGAGGAATAATALTLRHSGAKVTYGFLSSNASSDSLVHLAGPAAQHIASLLGQSLRGSSNPIANGLAANLVRAAPPLLRMKAEIEAIFDSANKAQGLYAAVCAPIGCRNFESAVRSLQRIGIGSLLRLHSEALFRRAIAKDKFIAMFPAAPPPPASSASAPPITLSADEQHTRIADCCALPVFERVVGKSLFFFNERVFDTLKRKFKPTRGVLERDSNGKIRSIEGFAPGGSGDDGVEDAAKVLSHVNHLRNNLRKLANARHMQLLSTINMGKVDPNATASSLQSIINNKNGGDDDDDIAVSADDDIRIVAKSEPQVKSSIPAIPAPSGAAGKSKLLRQQSDLISGPSAAKRGSNGKQVVNGRSDSPSSASASAPVHREGSMLGNGASSGAQGDHESVSLLMNDDNDGEEDDAQVEREFIDPQRANSLSLMQQQLQHDRNSMIEVPRPSQQAQYMAVASGSASGQDVESRGRYSTQSIAVSMGDSQARGLAVIGVQERRMLLDYGLSPEFIWHLNEVFEHQVDPGMLPRRTIVQFCGQASLVLAREASTSSSVVSSNGAHLSAMLHGHGSHAENSTYSPSASPSSSGGNGPSPTPSPSSAQEIRHARLYTQRLLVWRILQGLTFIVRCTGPDNMSCVSLADRIAALRMSQVIIPLTKILTVCSYASLGSFVEDIALPRSGSFGRKSNSSSTPYGGTPLSSSGGGDEPLKRSNSAHSSDPYDGFVSIPNLEDIFGDDVFARHCVAASASIIESFCALPSTRSVNNTWMVTHHLVWRILECAEKHVASVLAGKTNEMTMGLLRLLLATLRYNTANPADLEILRLEHQDELRRQSKRRAASASSTRRSSAPGSSSSSSYSSSDSIPQLSISSSGSSNIGGAEPSRASLADFFTRRRSSSSSSPGSSSSPLSSSGSVLDLELGSSGSNPISVAEAAQRARQSLSAAPTPGLGPSLVLAGVAARPSSSSSSYSGASGAAPSRSSASSISAYSKYAGSSRPSLYQRIPAILSQCLEVDDTVISKAAISLTRNLAHLFEALYKPSGVLLTLLRHVCLRDADYVEGVGSAILHLSVAYKSSKVLQQAIDLGMLNIFVRCLFRFEPEVQEKAAITLMCFTSKAMCIFSSENTKEVNRLLLSCPPEGRGMVSSLDNFRRDPNSTSLQAFLESIRAVPRELREALSHVSTRPLVAQGIVDESAIL